MTKHHSNALSARQGGGDRGGASANQNETPPTRTLRLPERCPPLDRFMALDPAPEQTRGDEDNQQVTEDYAGMSLELLALLSPHGTTQQWEEDDDGKDSDTEAKEGYQDCAKRLSVLAGVGLNEYSGHNQTLSQEAIDLTSPTQHMMPFQASPTHSAHGNELDLASPVTLPESPQSHSLWGSESETYIELDEQDDNIADEATADSAVSATVRSKTSVRSSPSTANRRTAHGSGRSPNLSRGKTEMKPKARHGGIYSLLLKNKPLEHEPTLVCEKRSPHGPEGAFSVSKKASPPSIAKLQHGGIYGMLRRASKSSE